MRVLLLLMMLQLLLFLFQRLTRPIDEVINEMRWSR